MSASDADFVGYFDDAGDYYHRGDHVYAAAAADNDAVTMMSCSFLSHLMLDLSEFFLHFLRI